jgi:hypothetical protein
MAIKQKQIDRFSNYKAVAEKKGWVVADYDSCCNYVEFTARRNGVVVSILIGSTLGLRGHISGKKASSRELYDAIHN